MGVEMRRDVIAGMAVLNRADSMLDLASMMWVSDVPVLVHTTASH